MKEIAPYYQRFELFKLAMSVTPPKEKPPLWILEINKTRKSKFATLSKKLAALVIVNEAPHKTPFITWVRLYFFGAMFWFIYWKAWETAEIEWQGLPNFIFMCFLTALIFIPTGFGVWIALVLIPDAINWLLVNIPKKLRSNYTFKTFIEKLEDKDLNFVGRPEEALDKSDLVAWGYGWWSLFNSSKYRSIGATHFLTLNDEIEATEVQKYFKTNGKRAKDPRLNHVLIQNPLIEDDRSPIPMSLRKLYFPQTKYVWAPTEGNLHGEVNSEGELNSCTTCQHHIHLPFYKWQCKNPSYISSPYENICFCQGYDNIKQKGNWSEKFTRYTYKTD